MAYILNTSVPENKKCIVALNEIHGLGKNLTVQICDQLGFSPQIKCRHLSLNQIDRLTRCISQNYLTGVDLKDKISKSKERLVAINSYRGFRYIERLPCRGQRTHGNAQTARKNARAPLTKKNNSVTFRKKR